MAESENLNKIFEDLPEVNYLAHMVSHYRYNHVVKRNYFWFKGGYRYKGDWFDGYDEAKKKVNERAKCLIIKTGKDVLQLIGITPEHFEQLQNTEDKTMELARKMLTPCNKKETSPSAP